MCARESPFTPELDPLLQDTAVKRDVFFFQCAAGVHLVRRCCLPSGGFLGIVVVGGVRLTFLEERKAANEIWLAASGTITRMKIAPKRSPMNKSLFMYQESVNGGRTSSRISYISFQEVNTGM